MEEGDRPAELAAARVETQPRDRRLPSQEPAQGRRKRPPGAVHPRAGGALLAREENLLRAAFHQDYAGHGAKARGVVEAVEKIGLEPFHAPAPLPPIRAEEVHLVCWLAIEQVAGN